MDQPQAVDHLRQACVPANAADAALIAEWTGARARLGAAPANGGHPDIQPLPVAQQAHVQALRQAQWLAPAFAPATPHAPAGPLHNVDFNLVEVDPLLAFQFTVNTDRSAHHCNALTHPPSMDELMNLCLPLNPPPFEDLHIAQQGQSIVMKTRCLNFHTTAQGAFQAHNILGIQFGVSLPFVHVVRFNGRCYLHNGFHRAYGARTAGATHVPCVFRDVPDALAAGIRGNGATFELPLLESGNPPTVGHFTSGRAHVVQLRGTTRIIHASWAEYTMYDE
jgi:hypothetical protein